MLVKLDSPGPVFYVQERMGLDARSFKMIKFRSMREDAETDGPGWTTPDDPRRTKLGALMRRFNVDELPQLVNVLIGDMSLVGPRPERPVYVEQFRQSIPRYMDRHRERAGLTGWAQVNGSARRYVDHRAHQIRSLVYRELVAGAGHQDTDPHGVSVALRRQAERLLTPARRLCVSPAGQCPNPKWLCTTRAL